MQISTMLFFWSWMFRNRSRVTVCMFQESCFCLREKLPNAPVCCRVVLLALIVRMKIRMVSESWSELTKARINVSNSVFSTESYWVCIQSWAEIEMILHRHSGDCIYRTVSSAQSASLWLQRGLVEIGGVHGSWKSCLDALKSLSITLDGNGNRWTRRV